MRYVSREDIIGGSSRLMNKYRNKGKLKWQELLEAFQQCHIPDDQVNLEVAYLVKSLIFAKHAKTLVDPRILAILVEVDAFNRVC